MGHICLLWVHYIMWSEFLEKMSHQNKKKYTCDKIEMMEDIEFNLFGGKIRNCTIYYLCSGRATQNRRMLPLSEKKPNSTIILGQPLLRIRHYVDKRNTEDLVSPCGFKLNLKEYSNLRVTR